MPPRPARTRPAHARLFTAAAGLCMLALLTSTGCTASRYSELRDQSKDVERELVRERSQALTAPAADRDARLSRLNGLWASLTAVDIALAATRHAVPEAQRPVIYDAIEEAYDTISWNAPLPVGAPMRELPASFRAGRFNLEGTPAFITNPDAAAPARP